SKNKKHPQSLIPYSLLLPPSLILYSLFLVLYSLFNIPPSTSLFIIPCSIFNIPLSTSLFTIPCSIFFIHHSASATTSLTSGIILFIIPSIPAFKVIIEEGQPLQLPCSIRFTTPSL